MLPVLSAACLLYTSIQLWHVGRISHPDLQEGGDQHGYTDYPFLDTAA